MKTMKTCFRILDMWSMDQHSVVIVGLNNCKKYKLQEEVINDSEATTMVLGLTNGGEGRRIIKTLPINDGSEEGIIIVCEDAVLVFLRRMY